MVEKKIPVIGATGNVGVPVAQCLKADGFQVRMCIASDRMRCT